MKKVNNQLQKQQLINNSSNSTKWMYWLLALLTFFIYANSINNGYNLDDEIVTNNHPLTSQGIKAIVEIFTSPYYKDDMGYSYGYRPIVHVSFAIEHELFGENPQVSHFFNVLLYALSVILFFHLLQRLFGKNHLPLIFIAVLFFAVHPVHSEVVASIKNRDEILALLLAITSGNSLLRLSQRIDRNRFLFAVPAFLFLLGMLAKKSIFPLAIVFPLSFSFFNSISWRSFLLSLFVLVFPATLVSSELEVNRFLVHFFVSLLIGIILHYFIGLVKHISIEVLIKELFKNQLFLVFSIFTIIFLSTYFENRWILICTLPFFNVLQRNHQLLGITLISFTMMFINFQFRQFDYILISVFLLTSFYFFKQRNNSRNRHLFIVTIFFLVSSIAIEINQSGFDSGIFAKYFSILLFFIIRKYKVHLTIFFTPLICLAFADYENLTLDFLLMSILIISSYDSFVWIRKKEKFNLLIALFGVIWLVLTVLQQNRENSLKIKNITFSKVENVVIDTSYQGEGRALNYVENTLVARHYTSEALATGFVALGEYFRLMVFPKELSFYYGYAKIKTTNFNDRIVWLSILIHLSLAGLAFWKLRSQQIVSFGVLWYLSAILLFSNWFEFVAGMVGERLAFTASAGFSIFLAGVIYWLKPDFNFRKPRLLEFSVIVVLILFSIRTISRNSDWKDAVTLMSRDINHLQNSAQANNLFALNLAKFADEQQDEYIKRMNFIKAKKHFKQAFTIYSNFPNAYYDYARVSMILGENQDAIFGLKKSIQYNPTFNQPYLMLCEYYDMQKDATNMRETANKWIKNTPEELAYIALCKSYILKGDKMTAKKVLIKGQTNYPNGTQIASLIKDFDSVFKD